MRDEFDLGRGRLVLVFERIRLAVDDDDIYDARRTNDSNGHDHDDVHDGRNGVDVLDIFGQSGPTVHLWPEH
jgi:hypothetical protein